MKIPTNWTTIEHVKIPIKKMSDKHIKLCLEMLNGILNRRGNKTYKPLPHGPKYPHIGHEESFIAAFVREQARRKNID